MLTQGFLRYIYISLTLGGIFCALFFFHYEYTNAALIQSYSDKLSDSGPNESSNHTINFITKATIPVNGFIRFTPEDGMFDIPSSADFDIDNVALYVATSSGYILRSATVTPSATEDGIAITTGTSGQIEITLNSDVSIPANANIRLLIGSHTPNATGTDVGITNPNATGTHSYVILAGDGVSDTQVRGLIAITDKVYVGDIDTHEQVPPFRFNGAPAGEISGTTLIVQISLETDEFAKCRFSTASNTPFISMGNEFTSNFSTIHAKNVAVATNTSYAFYVRCIDDEENVNIDDYVISFAVPQYPLGTPGDVGTNQGTGDGTGGGSGSGNSGSGSGSSGGSSAGSTSGGGSTGGGGSGSGGGSSGVTGSDSGGFEGSISPYQSGDGQVIITGYAFPQSTVVALVDGQIAKSVKSNAKGEFTMTLDAIARGAYTFGVYGIDRDSIKSSTFSTTFTVTGSRGSTLSNINVMPSLKVTPDPVDPNSTVKVSGYAIPDATITLENQNDKTSASLKTFTATSDKNGAWSIDISTDGFTTGTYKVRAKAKQETGVSTNFSNYTYYGVGAQADVPRTSDLNRDGKVNLTDFSILLFWWGTDGGASNPPADINRDGKVSLTDFSILIFNWTG